MLASHEMTFKNLILYREIFSFYINLKCVLKNENKVETYSFSGSPSEAQNGEGKWTRLVTDYD